MRQVVEFELEITTAATFEITIMERDDVDVNI
jgi:hypothetical protein